MQPEIKIICFNIIKIIIKINWEIKLIETSSQLKAINQTSIISPSLKIYQELFEAKNINSSNEKIVNKYSGQYHNLCLIHSIQKPVGLLIAIYGSYFKIKENTNIPLANNINISLASTDFTYEYYTSNVFILNKAYIYNIKNIGLITETDFICMYNTESYIKIAKIIKNKYVKEITRQKALDKALDKTAKKIQFIRGTSEIDNIEKLKNDIIKQAKFIIVNRIYSSNLKSPKGNYNMIDEHIFNKFNKKKYFT